LQWAQWRQNALGKSRKRGVISEEPTACALLLRLDGPTSADDALLLAAGWWKGGPVFRSKKGTQWMAMGRGDRSVSGRRPLPSHEVCFLRLQLLAAARALSLSLSLSLTLLRDRCVLLSRLVEFIPPSTVRRARPCPRCGVRRRGRFPHPPGYRYSYYFLGQPILCGVRGFGGK
jgi:hypothetical protein